MQDSSDHERAAHHAQRTASLDPFHPSACFIYDTSSTSMGKRRSLRVTEHLTSDSDTESSHDDSEADEDESSSTYSSTNNGATHDHGDVRDVTSRLPVYGYSDSQSAGRPSYNSPPSNSSLFQTRRLPMPNPRYPGPPSTIPPIRIPPRSSMTSRNLDVTLQSTETRDERNMPSPRVSSQPSPRNLVHHASVSIPPISQITEIETARNSGMVQSHRANTHSGRKKRKRMPDSETPSHSKRHAVERKIAMSTQSETSQGFFTGARDFVVHKPTMIDMGQVTHIRNDRPDETLRWLKEYTMHGAEFDSSERDPPPRCHPNTRESIVQRVKDWIDSPCREKKQLWIRGAAGVGKSAIVQTLAEGLAKKKRLGGSVFISRPNGLNNPNRVFPSIAYQLAVQDMDYRAYITSLMLEDPRSLEKSMKEQLRILIIEPFVKKRLRHGLDDLVIALDGLDECDGDPAQDDPRFRNRTSDHVQCEIVQLISDLVLQYPSIPLIWIISSRPEKHLQTVFYDEVVRSSFWEEDIPVDSDEACKDVERFLVSEFERIQKKYPDHMPHDTLWPHREDFTMITKAALGLFIFAEVVVRFVDDSCVKNPIAQLKIVLLTISQLNPSSNVNPLAVLDAIYIEILKRVPSKVIGPAKEIIAYMISLDRRKAAKSKFNLAMICNALFIPKDVAVTALHHLHSVLNFSGIKDIGLTRPRFYHASFRDFLEDPSRSHEFSIENIRSSFSNGGCLGLALSEHLRTEESPSWPGEHKVTKRTVDRAPANRDAGPVALPFSFSFLSTLLPSHDFAAVASELSIDDSCMWDEETIL